MKRALLAIVAVLAALALGLGPVLESFGPASDPFNRPNRALGDSHVEVGQGLGRWTEADCWFDEGWLKRSRCAWLFPREAGSGEPVALPVVLLQRSLLGRSRAVTVYLSGGPGGGSWLYQEAMPYWRDWAGRLGLDHDLLLYDQRGAGYALPELYCDAIHREYAAQLGEVLDPQAVWDRLEPLWRDCADEVPAVDRRFGVFSTPTSAADLAALVAALRERWGYEEVRLYGVSYGSRLAQVSLAEPPEGVSRAVLDAFYPAGQDLVRGFAQDFARILEAKDAHCRRQPGCDPAEEGLRGLLGRALASVSAEPLALPLDAIEPIEGALGPPTRVMLTPSMLFALFEHMLTAGQDYASLRQRLQEVLARAPGAPWTDVALEYAWGASDPDSSELTFMLNECRDNPPLSFEEAEAERLAHPDWSEALALAPGWFELCEVLGVRPNPLPAAVPQRPTLLLAAEFDPRTPTERALAAAAGFRDSAALVLPVSGHGLVEFDECAARAAGAFLNSGAWPSAEACGGRLLRFPTDP